RGAHLPGAALAKPRLASPAKGSNAVCRYPHIREVPSLNADDRAELDELGWNEAFASAFDALQNDGVEPGRLAADYGTKFLVQLAASAPLATLGSALRGARLVAVGDWVAVRTT